MEKYRVVHGKNEGFHEKSWGKGGGNIISKSGDSMIKKSESDGVHGKSMDIISHFENSAMLHLYAVVGSWERHPQFYEGNGE